ncbi:UDP-N-acetylmuramate-alanine ligase [Streptococcus pneumoniae]|nr:UDP-N-acetylmuramate-alanine ligase [Streptococcus pneumoniae]
MSKTYHFIGIKGSGMSALALMLHQMGHKVQGSDVEKYYFTQRGLEQAGITILPFDEKNLDGDMEIILEMPFVQITTSKLPMRTKMVSATNVTMSF